MRYRLYHNLLPESRTDGWNEDDPMWLDPTTYDTGDVELPAPRLVNAMDLVHALHSHPNRADAAVAPPLTLGDVLALEVWEDTFRYYTVTSWNIVFEPENVVTGPTWAEALDLAAAATVE